SPHGIRDRSSIGIFNCGETLHPPSRHCSQCVIQAQESRMSCLIRTLLQIFRTLPPTLSFPAAYCVLLAACNGRQSRRSAIFARCPPPPLPIFTTRLPPRKNSPSTN